LLPLCEQKRIPRAPVFRMHRTTSGAAPFYKVGFHWRGTFCFCSRRRTRAGMATNNARPPHTSSSSPAPRAFPPPLQKGGQGGFAFAPTARAKANPPRASLTHESHHTGRRPPFTKWAFIGAARSVFAAIAAHVPAWRLKTRDCPTLLRHVLHPCFSPPLEKGGRGIRFCFYSGSKSESPARQSFACTAPHRAPPPFTKWAFIGAARLLW